MEEPVGIACARRAIDVLMEDPPYWRHASGMQGLRSLQTFSIEDSTSCIVAPRICVERMELTEYVNEGCVRRTPEGTRQGLQLTTILLCMRCHSGRYIAMTGACYASRMSEVVLTALSSSLSLIGAVAWPDLRQNLRSHLKMF